MDFRNITVLHRGDATLVEVPKAVVAAINEHNYPSPLAAELLAEFGQAIATAPAGIVLDMRDTEYVDHASVDVVFRLARQLADRNKPRAICCSEPIKDVLDACRIGSFCPTVTALDMAINWVSREQEQETEPGGSSERPRD
jgi:hypothetical protein